MARIENYRHRGGAHWETGSLTTILASLDVRAPHTGEPYSEAMLMGLGGGIGGGYMVFEMCGGKYVVCGFRHNWQKYKGEFTEAVCARLDVPVEVREAGGRKQSEAHLVSALDEGRPVWATTAEAALPHRGLPRELAKGFVYGLVVYGYEGDDFLVDDLCPAEIRLSREEMAFTRSVITANKNRILVFSPPDREPDLRPALRDALRQCVEEMLNPPIRNFGLTAWEKWAGLAVHPKDKKGWPTLLDNSRDLADALRTVYGCMLKEGGADASRGQYAAFLEEAREILGLAALSGVAEQYRELAAEWQAFAGAVLPDTNPVLKELRECIEGRNRLLRTEGAAAQLEVERLYARGIELKDQPNAIPEAERKAIYAELETRLTALHRKESAAIHALQAAIV